MAYNLPLIHFFNVKLTGIILVTSSLVIKHADPSAHEYFDLFPVLIPLPSIICLMFVCLFVCLLTFSCTFTTVLNKLSQNCFVFIHTFSHIVLIFFKCFD